MAKKLLHSTTYMESLLLILQYYSNCFRTFTTTLKVTNMDKQATSPLLKSIPSFTQHFNDFSIYHSLLHTFLGQAVKVIYAEMPL